MSEEVYKNCDIVKENMKFYTYNEFCENRKYLKYNFKYLSDTQKKLYMWYIYANINMNETYKNAIWDYLNDYMQDWELLKLLRYYNNNPKEAFCRCCSKKIREEI